MGPGPPSVPPPGLCPSLRPEGPWGARHRHPPSISLRCWPDVARAPVPGRAGAPAWIWGACRWTRSAPSLHLCCAPPWGQHPRLRPAPPLSPPKASALACGPGCPGEGPRVEAGKTSIRRGASSLVGARPSSRSLKDLPDHAARPPPAPSRCPSRAGPSSCWRWAHPRSSPAGGPTSVWPSLSPGRWAPA